MTGAREGSRSRSPLWIVFAACSGLLLAVSLAILLPPALAKWREGRATSYEHVLRQGLPPSEEAVEVVSSVGAEDFSAFLRSTAPSFSDPYGDPWLFAALVIGYLRLHNVPLWEPAVATLYSTQTRDQVRTKPGDTWSTLAATHLGDANLWPLLVLLNREWTMKRGLALEPGILVSVADAKKLSEPAGGGQR